MFSKYGSSSKAPPVYTEAAMPLPTAVPDGFVVWNSTWKVLLRSTGTRWIALSAFTAYGDAPADSLTGSTDETLLRGVLVPFHYVNTRGRIGITLGQTNTNNANNKTLRIRLGETAGVAGTLILATNSTTTGKSSSKHVYAAGSESAQFCSGINVISDASTANSPLALTENWAGAGYVSITGQLAAAGDTMTLTAAQVVVYPGN